MRKLLAAAGLVLAIAASACTTTTPKLVTTLPSPLAAGSTVLVVRPDVELSIVTASGAPERRADWSQSGASNLVARITRVVTSKGFRTEMIEPGENLEGRAGQLLRLHEAVGTTILVNEYLGIQLPSRKDRGFDYTLGAGTRELTAGRDASYVMFVYASGCYSSGGRMAVVMIAAVAGVSIPTCSQQMIASLVDSQTGQVVWFNHAVAGPNADMREQPGADSLVNSVLATVPF
jgi:hypothetical protein